MEKLLVILLVIAAILIIILAQPVGAGAVLICGVCAAFAVLLINKNFDGEERTFLRKLFIIALLLRILLAAVTYIFHVQDFFGGDSITYALA